MSAWDLVPLVWVLLTLSVYLLAKRLHRRLNWVLSNPMIVTVTVLILLLLALQVDFADYGRGGKYISFFLGPSVVALGVLFYERFGEIGQRLKPFLLAVTLGGLGSILSVVLILVLLDAPSELIRSLAPKSVTTPIAIEISKSISGEPNITAGIVIAVGVLGSSLGVYLLRALGIGSMRAIGTALGTAAHGIGTARALEESRLAGVYSGLALCVNGLFTALVLPLIMNWF